MEKPASRPKKYWANAPLLKPVLVYSSTRAGAIQTASSYFGVPVEKIEISPVYFPVRPAAPAFRGTSRRDFSEQD